MWVPEFPVPEYKYRHWDPSSGKCPLCPSCLLLVSACLLCGFLGLTEKLWCEVTERTEEAPGRVFRGVTDGPPEALFGLVSIHSKAGVPPSLSLGLMLTRLQRLSEAMVSRVRILDEGMASSLRPWALGFGVLEAADNPLKL